MPNGHTISTRDRILAAVSRWAIMELRAVLFVLTAGGLIYAAIMSPTVWLIPPLSYVALSFVLVGLGYGGLGPRVFFKRSNGTVPWISYALLAPVHVINWGSLGLFRLLGRQSAFNEIADSVLLGCRLMPTDRGALEACGVTAVLDLTCELPESRFLRNGPYDYLAIPVLDAGAPTLDELRRGVRFIQSHVHRGQSVYVHCALGHGRSATFVAAWAMEEGLASDPTDAHEMLRRHRPGVGMHRPQMSILRLYAAGLRRLWSVGQASA